MPEVLVPTSVNLGPVKEDGDRIVVWSEWQEDQPAPDLPGHAWLSTLRAVVAEADRQLGTVDKPEVTPRG